MADKKWEKQLMDFIKRTGEELKRTSDELKVEAQRLLDEVRDPARQAKVKETLKDLRDKATAMTKEAAEKLEVRRAQGGGRGGTAFDRNKEGSRRPRPSPPPPRSRHPGRRRACSRRQARSQDGQDDWQEGRRQEGRGHRRQGPRRQEGRPKSIGRKKPTA